MDIILQMHNQSYAHRVCLLAQNERVESILPRGKFGESAEELGPKKSMHFGPNLVMLRKCTASKAEIINHIHTTFLRRYVARIYWCHHTAPSKEAVVAQVLEDLRQESLKQASPNGHSFSNEDLSDQHRTAMDGPRSIGGEENPLDVKELSGSVAACCIEEHRQQAESDTCKEPPEEGCQVDEAAKSKESTNLSERSEPNQISDALAQSRQELSQSELNQEADVGAANGGAKGRVRLRVQACPKSLETFFTDNLPDVDIGMANFTHVLGIAEVHAPHFGNSATQRWLYYYGLSPKEDVYFQRDLRGGVGSEGRGTGDLQCLHGGSVSKAVLKIEEILEAVGWPLRPATTVIDLGAAPGAWTAFFARHVARVAAVDPAEMAEDAMLENVTHIRKAALDARDDLATWQRDQLSDLLVCDINKHPKEVLKWSEPLFPFLRPGGLFIMTLKFFGKARDKKEALSILSPMVEKHFDDIDCIWLLANTVHERTLVARKR